MSDMASCEKCPFMTLQDHLRETLLALIKIEKPASAWEVSDVTGKCRAVESNNLNELTRLGYVHKLRRFEKKRHKPGNPRKVYFSLTEVLK